MMSFSRGVRLMTAAEIYDEIFASVVPVAALWGFVIGTGFGLFAWMMRQPYRIFRKIVGV